MNSAVDGNTQNEQNKILTLSWDAAVFIPDLQESEIITEVLNIDDFSPGVAEEYWSVPEHLADIRWAISRMGRSDIRQEDFSDFLRLEFGLHRTVTELWKIAKSLESNAQTIVREEELDKFWQQLVKEHIGLLRSLPQKHITDIGELEIQEIKKIAEKFTDSKIILDERATLLAKQASQVVKTKNYTEHSSKSCIVDFAKMLYSMIDDIQWRKESVAKDGVKTIVSIIAKFKTGSWKPDGVEWTEEYIHSVRAGIQETANTVCNLICSKDTHQQITIASLMDTVDDVLRKLGKGRAADALQAYASNQKRCVALLELISEHHVDKYMAFSGFLDCSDDSAISGDFAGPILQTYQDICKRLGCTLVTMSPEVRSRVKRYGLDEHLKLTEQDNLCNECGGSNCFDCEKCAQCKQNRICNKKDKVKERLKARYSCCERKILAYIEKIPKVDIDTAIMHVKFEPCLSCYGNLLAWKADINNLILDYPLVTL